MDNAMPKQISPDQALALSFSPFRFKRIKTDKRGVSQKDKDGNLIYEMADTPRFIKPGETQASALKRLRNHQLGRTKQSAASPRVPAFSPGVTTTMQYVAAFERLNNLVHSGSALHLNKPAPILEGEDIVVDTYAEDLV
jgi:hypothetical protein